MNHTTPICDALAGCSVATWLAIHFSSFSEVVQLTAGILTALAAAASFAGHIYKWVKRK